MWRFWLCVGSDVVQRNLFPRIGWAGSWGLQLLKQYFHCSFYRHETCHSPQFQEGTGALFWVLKLELIRLRYGGCRDEQDPDDDPFLHKSLGYCEITGTIYRWFKQKLFQINLNKVYLLSWGRSLFSWWIRSDGLSLLLQFLLYCSGHSPRPSLSKVHSHSQANIGHQKPVWRNWCRVSSLLFLEILASLKSRWDSMESQVPGARHNLLFERWPELTQLVLYKLFCIPL